MPQHAAACRSMPQHKKFFRGTAHACWHAYGRGSSPCISWHQIQLSLTARHVCYRTALWDNCSIGQLCSWIPRDFPSAFWRAGFGSLPWPDPPTKKTPSKIARECGCAGCGALCRQNGPKLIHARVPQVRTDRKVAYGLPTQTRSGNTHASTCGLHKHTVWASAIRYGEEHSLGGCRA